MIFRYKIKFISDIEQKIRKLLVNISVTPFVGVSLPSLNIIFQISFNTSHSLRGSVTPFVLHFDIKYRKLISHSLRGSVTPFVGVWIEIMPYTRLYHIRYVTPFVGVWIEIIELHVNTFTMSQSLPSWECGLKFVSPVTLVN